MEFSIISVTALIVGLISFEMGVLSNKDSFNRDYMYYAIITQLIGSGFATFVYYLFGR